MATVVDVPKISQRSLIAFCIATGNNVLNPGDPGYWIGVPTRAGLNVSALTNVITLKVNGANQSIIRQPTYDGDHMSATGGIRVNVNGNVIGVDIFYYSRVQNDSYYGYDDRGSFTLTATTAGDAARGIEGATVSYTINVLVLGRDWLYPSGSTDMVLVRRGSVWTGSNRLYFPSLVKHADKFGSESANTGYGIAAAGGGQKLVSSVKVSDNFADSGLVLHSEKPEGGNFSAWLTGTAARPGIYRLAIEGESIDDATETQREPHYYMGGPGRYALTVCIYEPYMKGDLVVVLPQRPQIPDRNIRSVAHMPGTGQDWESYITLQPFERFTRAAAQGVTWYDHWGASHVIELATTIPSYVTYYYRIEKSNGTWNLHGFRFDADISAAYAAGYTIAQLKAMLPDPNDPLRYRLLASVAARAQLSDEHPPLQGWPAGYVLYGDRSWYVRPEGDGTHGGWYSYAGYAEYTPVDPDPEDEEEPEPVRVDVYERSIHYNDQFDGWNTGTEYQNSGLFFLVNAPQDNSWRVTDSAAALANLGTATSWPTVAPIGANSAVAVPYCPGKKGDFGVAIDTDGGKIFHSLSNQFPSSYIRTVFDGIAGAQWMYYPMRRMLSLFKTGGKVKLNLTKLYRRTTETEGGDVGARWGKYSQYTGVPPVTAIQAASGRAIKVGHYRTYTTITSGYEIKSSAEVEVPVEYAVWNSHRILEELWGQAQTSDVSSAISGSITIINQTDTTVIDIYKKYALRRPYGDPPFSPQDYNYYWTVTGASGAGEAHFDQTETPPPSEPLWHNGWVRYNASETWIYNGTSWVRTGTRNWDINHMNSDLPESGSESYTPGGNPSWNLNPSANVTVDGVLYPHGYLEVEPMAPGYNVISFPKYGTPVRVGLSINSTTASASFTFHDSGTDGGSISWTEDCAGNFSVTATQFPKPKPAAQSPLGSWDYQDLPEYDGLVHWEAYSCEEKDYILSQKVDGPTAEGGTLSEQSGWARAQVLFGEGRDSDDVHRVITVSATGLIGYSAAVTISDDVGDITTDTKQSASTARTHSPDPDTDWDYHGYNAPNGEPLSDSNWGEEFETTEVDTDSFIGESQPISESRDFLSGLCKHLLAAIFVGVSHDGSEYHSREFAACTGGYTVVDYDGNEISAETYDEQGLRTIHKKNTPGMPPFEDEIEVEGTDPDEVALPDSPAATLNIEGGSWTVSRWFEEVELNYTFSASTQSD